MDGFPARREFVVGKLRKIHRKTKPASGSNIGVQNVGWSVGPNRPAAAAARHDSGSQTIFDFLETVPFKFIPPWMRPICVICRQRYPTMSIRRHSWEWIHRNSEGAVTKCTRPVNDVGYRDSSTLSLSIIQGSEIKMHDCQCTRQKEAGTAGGRPGGYPYHT